MISIQFWLIALVLVAAITALSFARLVFNQTRNKSAGNEKMQSIALAVGRGAMSYLKQQYKVVAVVFFFLAFLFAISAYVYNTQSPYTWVAFLTGGLGSGLCGYLGMKTAAMTAPRVVKALEKSLGAGVKVALYGASVPGFLVVGIALLDIAVWFTILSLFTDTGNLKMLTITTTMMTFGIGASTQAIFARLGGGIYTKGADIGADLIGKVEFNMNEDDSRNPAVIADNVGDLVGDVAGMGADLFESYVGSIVATAVLGVAATLSLPEKTQNIYAILPMLISAVGIIASIIGLHTIKVNNGYQIKEIVRSMNNSIFISSAIVAASTFLITYYLDMENWLGLSLCVVIGVLVGSIIGESTNYYTSHGHKPVRHIAESAKISPATVIIAGLSVGMTSTFWTILAIGGGMGLSFYLASDGVANNIYFGMYGIGIAAVGMLSTLGLTLATDAYGPIADNAGGNAEMSHLPAAIREQTDVLDGVGNTTAAIGKGFAIGSAALTAMALLASYVEELRIALLRHGHETIQLISGESILTSTANMIQFMDHYQVNLMNINLLIGLFVGSMLVMVFVGKCMKAVGNVAELLATEVRRQFQNAKVLSGEEDPDTQECIRITTRGAQIAMIFPASMAIVTPLLVGQLLGVPGVMGLIAGCFCTGLVTAVFMANSGGAWDNAKKYIESGQLGGKNSPAHKAAVIGDMVGDPFKDTAGPSLNILIKLVAMVSIVSAGLVALA